MIAIKGCTAFPKALALLELHHHCLVSYPGHLLPSAEMHLVYSTSPVAQSAGDVIIYFCIIYCKGNNRIYMCRATCCLVNIFGPPIFMLVYLEKAKEANDV